MKSIIVSLILFAFASHALAHRPLFDQIPAKAPEPKPVDAALEKAAVGGKYSKLLRKIEVPDDVTNYGKFCDYGHYTGTSWAGYDNLPAGYWVYVAPHWYIWGQCKDQP